MKRSSQILRNIERMQKTEMQKTENEKLNREKSNWERRKVIIIDENRVVKKVEKKVSRKESFSRHNYSAKLPDVNRWIEVGRNICIARLKIPVTALPPRDSLESARKIEMDLVVEFDMHGSFPHYMKGTPLYAQTVDGKHSVRMVGYGIGNLSHCVEEILRGEIPNANHFPAIVTPIRQG